METKSESEDNCATQDLENAKTCGDTSTTNVMSESKENPQTETDSTEPSGNLSIIENNDSAPDKDTNTTNDLSESTEIEESQLGELIQSKPGEGETLLGAMNTQVPVRKKIRGRKRSRKQKNSMNPSFNKTENRVREESRNLNSNSEQSVQSIELLRHNPASRISVRRRESLYENQERENPNSFSDSSVQQNSDPRVSSTREQSTNASDRKTITNPLKRKRTRPLRSKQKMQRIPMPEAPKEETPIVELCVDGPDDVEYCLTVSNLPKSMSFMEIKNYFDTEVGPVDEIELIKDNETGFGAIRLSYQNENECKEAKKKLEGKVVAGNKIILEMSVVSTESDTETKTELTPELKTPETAVVPNKPWKPDLDSWEVDHKGMYGLKMQYLKSLGITPPLDKWVHVSNFRCDKSELRDILEMAGNVQMCSVFTTANRYANVMYSHPLEAVQAVAMLNNQKLYGQDLKVAMDRSPADTILLPKGLSSIGSGLGRNGKPLRNIVKHYERFLDSKECLISPVAFNISYDYSMKNDVKFVVKNVEDFNYQIPEVKMPAAPIIVKQTPPKPIQISSPKPKVQTAAYTQPVKTTPSQDRPYNAAYSTFVAPQTNGGSKQMTVPQLMQNTVPTRPVSISGPMAQGQMGLMGSGPIRPAPMRPGPIAPGTMGQGPMAPGSMGPRPMGSGPIGPGPMIQGPMGPGPVGQAPLGPRPMGQGPMGQRPMGHGPMGPRPMGQIPMGQGPMGPRPMGQGPMGPGPMGHGPLAPGQMGPRPMGPGPMGPTGSFNNEPVKMILRNLPPSTTFAILCEKMSEWGHVVCLQLTTPGCAVVTFGNRMQADACFHHYNGRSIDNHIIQMHYA